MAPLQRETKTFPSERLRAEITRLVPVAQSKHRDSGSSVLAALLEEAVQRKAHREWGHVQLGHFTRDLGIAPKTFAKYKTAGKALREHRPRLYAAVLAAVRDGGVVPRLPAVSDLARLPSIVKSLGAAAARARIDLVFDGGRAKTVHLMDRVADARLNGPQREVLQKFEQHATDLERFLAFAQELLGDTARIPPRDIIGVATARITAACIALEDVVEAVKSAPPKSSV